MATGTSTESTDCSTESTDGEAHGRSVEQKVVTIIITSDECNELEDPGFTILYASEQDIHQCLGLPSARNVTAMNYGHRIDPLPFQEQLQLSLAGFQAWVDNVIMTMTSTTNPTV